MAKKSVYDWKIRDLRDMQANSVLISATYIPYDIANTQILQIFNVT